MEIPACWYSVKLSILYFWERVGDEVVIQILER